MSGKNISSVKSTNPFNDSVKNKGFERKLKSNGTENPKYVDLLEEDKPISGQKFVCVSFVSPENILKRKELYLFKE